MIKSAKRKASLPESRTRWKPAAVPFLLSLWSRNGEETSSHFRIPCVKGDKVRQKGSFVANLGGTATLL